MHGGTRYLSYVFTKYGIMMLSGLLKSDIAARINIETKLLDYDNNFKEIFNKFETKTNNHLFYDGQIYDEYLSMLYIINTSNNIKIRVKKGE